MFLELFKKNRNFLILFIPLFTFIIWFPSFYNDEIQVFNYNYYPTQFYRILNYYTLQLPVFSKIITILLILLASHLVVRLNNKYLFIHERTYLPALFYVIIVSGILSIKQFNPVLLSSFFLLWALFKIFDTYKKENISFQFFDASILLSAGSLLYFDLIFFIVTIWAALIVLRPRFIWREWIFTFIGILIPYIFILSEFYLLDWNLSMLKSHIVNGLVFKTFKPDFMMGEKILFYTFLLLLFLSSWYILQTLYSKKIQIRKYFILFLAMFINTVLIALVFPHDNVNLIFYIAIPLSYLLTNYFEFTKENWFNKALFFIIVVMAIYTNYEFLLLK